MTAQTYSRQHNFGNDIALDLQFRLQIYPAELLNQNRTGDTNISHVDYFNKWQPRTNSPQNKRGNGLSPLTRRGRSDSVRKIVTGEFDAQILERAGGAGDAEPDQLRLQHDPDQ
jgi:hypothetical protein